MYQRPKWATFGCTWLTQTSPGTLAYDSGAPVKRMSREDRLRRWKERRPLLDEDPLEPAGCRLWAWQDILFICYIQLHSVVFRYIMLYYVIFIYCIFIYFPMFVYVCMWKIKQWYGFVKKTREKKSIMTNTWKKKERHIWVYYDFC